MPALPIYTTPAIRKLEELAALASGTLMQRAGAAAAEYARSLCGDTTKSILVLAGPGNNGGDAFEVAAHLKRWFFRVSAVFAHPLARAHRALVQKLNALGVPILALDVPSGIDANTGAIMGCAVRASHTITFIAYKPGLLTLDGPDHCGELKLDTLGLAPAGLLEPEGLLLAADILDRTIAPRPRNFHKGQAGSVGVLGGAAGMVGAAVIAGRAALKCGAGRVYLGLLTPRSPCIDDSQPELMLRKPAALLEKESVDVLVAGPGMGKADSARKLLRAALAAPVPVVLDADCSTRSQGADLSPRRSRSAGHRPS